jgi:hypothetical protein
MEQMAAGEEPDAPGHADERLGDAIMLAVLLFAFCAYWLLQAAGPVGKTGGERARETGRRSERGVCSRSGTRGTGLLGPV